MRLFTRVRKNGVHSKVHISRAANQFEVVSLCWYAVTAGDVTWIGETYRGKTCAACERINNGKKNKRQEPGDE